MSWERVSNQTWYEPEGHVQQKDTGSHRRGLTRWACLSLYNVSSTPSRTLGLRLSNASARGLEADAVAKDVEMWRPET